MRTRHLITSRSFGFALVALIATMLLAQAAMAQPTGTISFDENGIGTLTGPGGGTFPLTSLGVTVDPTNGLATLTYFLRGNPIVDGRPILPGDVVLTEIPGTPPSDLLRWLDDGRLFVYSDRPEPGETPDLADVGIPPNRQGNVLTLQETGPENGLNGLFGYVPTPNQPGFVGPPTSGFSMTYNFTSDTPEPASLSLGAIAGIALLRRRRRRRQ